MTHELIGYVHESPLSIRQIYPRFVIIAAYHLRIKWRGLPPTIASLTAALLEMRQLFQALGAKRIIISFALNILVAPTLFARNMGDAKTKDPPIEDPIPNEWHHELR